MNFTAVFALYGQKIGMLVFLFCASQAAAAAAQWIQGYRLENGQWKADRCPLPDAVYDRSLPTSRAQARKFREALLQLKQRKRYVPLNGSLPGKLDVYDAMMRDDALQQWLPDTQLYEGTRQLANLLERHPRGLFLKPSAGMQGKGALRLLPVEGGWQLDGRDRSNGLLSERYENPSDLGRWIHAFISNAPYVVQPCLNLTDEAGHSCDMRVLIQKDENGCWSFTGAAVRRGAPGSVTANLHGGGDAIMAQTVLNARYGNDHGVKLMKQICHISENAAACLERHFGRFAELGLDFGLEPQGRVWLLEANAKPGRQSFDSDRQISELAIRRPLHYALLLVSRQRPAFPSTSIQRRYIQEVHS